MESSKRGHAAAGESDRASRAGIEDRARSVEDNARSVEAQIVYVAHGSFINRRFVAPGVEHNTGQYEAHTVKVRDARPIAGHFKLDTHGFELVRHVSAVRDFFDRAEVDAIYPGEVAAAVKAVTGATRVATLGWMARTSGDLTRFKHRTVGYTHSGGVQPPAGEAHVDTAPDRADRMARSTYERVHGRSGLFAIPLLELLASVFGAAARYPASGVRWAQRARGGGDDEHDVRRGQYSR